VAGRVARYLHGGEAILVDRIAGEARHAAPCDDDIGNCTLLPYKWEVETVERRLKAIAHHARPAQLYSTAAQQ
jgi:hypothetical protein